ncbi:MAG: DUF2059 domain-containing protein [Pseudomonadota bacterium]
MKIFAATIFTMTVIATPILAETEEEKKLRIATDYAVQAAEDMDISKMVVQMWQPIVDQAVASGKTVSQEQRDKINAVYQETFAEPMLDLMKAQGPIMADHLSLAELEALSAFYATPEGRAVMQKFPEMFADQQPMIIEMVQSNIGTVMPVIMEVLQ